MAELIDYSTTAASNNAASPDGYPSNMAPSGINDSAREEQAGWARHIGDENGALTTAGTGTALTLTSNRTITSLTNGLIMGFTAHAGNSGAAVTLNLNGIGATSVVLPDDSDPTLQANGVYRVVYNGALTKWQLISTTAPEVATPTFASETSLRTLTEGDKGYRYLRIDSSSVSLTLTSAVSTNGGKILILNPDRRSFDLTAQDLTIYLGDGRAALTALSSDSFTGTSYTIICESASVAYMVPYIAL